MPTIQLRQRCEIIPNINAYFYFLIEDSNKCFSSFLSFFVLIAPVKQKATRLSIRKYSRKLDFDTCCNYDGNDKNSYHTSLLWIILNLYILKVFLVSFCEENANFISLCVFGCGLTWSQHHSNWWRNCQTRRGFGKYFHICTFKNNQTYLT